MYKTKKYNPIISKGYADDIAAIMPVMNSAFDPEYGEAWNSAQCLSMLAMPHCNLILATQDEAVCGFAFTRGILEDEELLMLATHPDNMRSGIATKLMTYIIDKARNNKRKFLFLEMRQGNVAESFYDRFDFNRIALRQNYYRGISGTQYNAMTMQLRL